MSLRLTEAEYKRFNHIQRVFWGGILFWMFMGLLLVPQCGIMLPSQAQDSLQMVRDFVAANPCPPRPW